MGVWKGLGALGLCSLAVLVCATVERSILEVAVACREDVHRRRTGPAVLSGQLAGVQLEGISGCRELARSGFLSAGAVPVDSSHAGCSGSPARSTAVSGRAMMVALIAGERDPQTLAQLARSGFAPSWPTCGRRSRGRFTEHHAFLLSRVLGRIDTIDADIATVEDRIEDLVVRRL
jgi:hypothetical protein